MPARWYAASLQSNREFQVQKYLQGQRVVHFLPTYVTSSTRQDRAVMLNRPLFPGYIFVHIDVPGPQKALVLKSPGVCGLVCFSGMPAPVDDDIIHSLQIVTGAAAGSVRPHPMVKAGQKVRVTLGPFKNAIRVLCESENQKKQLVVEVSFLGRAVAVPIDPQAVAPVLG
ncbi:MAG: hypothetical protein JXX14_19190 [Deltaproteobacteria bacterium]|nr:hypothetical protein [Deltaproteobacteria bacterium]